jgi:hypothetical protein
MALDSTPVVTDEEPEALVEQRADLRGSQRDHARRGELDSERDAIDALADLRNRRRVLVVKVEVRSHGTSPLDEEPRRVGCAD